MTRSWIQRCLFAAVVTISHSAMAATGVTSDTITLGTSAPFSGPIQEWGKEYQRGADAYFAYINSIGGIHGRKISVQYLDDAYDPQRTVDNVRTLAKERAFAILSLCGTANTEAVLPILDSMQIPVIGTASGSDTVRAPWVRSRYLFHTRAGFSDETEKVADLLAATGVANIAVVFQNSGLGKAGLSSAQESIKRKKLRVAITAMVETDGSNVANAVRIVSAIKPQVIIMITAGAVSSKFIRAYQDSGAYARFFALNVVGSKQLVEDLGGRGRGVMVSQVVPHPWSNSMPISREYQQLMERAGQKTLSFVSMEGFVNAKLAATALKLAGPQPTREKFIDALESNRDIDLGGFLVRYSSSNHNGSSYVDLSILDANASWRR